MKRIRIAGLFVLAIIIAAGLLMALFTPPTSSVEIACLSGEAGCMQLPAITGTNLNGETQTFPDEFAHPYQLAIIPFDREQQVRLLDFVPLLKELSAARPDIGYYSLAALPDLAAPIRLLVSAGMSAVVTDPEVRAVAYIFYLEDRDAFLDALDLPDADAIRVYVFDNAGNVLWRAEGDFTPALAETIRAEIASLPVR